jgi:hypothetical protein
MTIDADDRSFLAGLAGGDNCRRGKDRERAGGGCLDERPEGKIGSILISSGHGIHSGTGQGVPG